MSTLKTLLKVISPVLFVILLSLPYQNCSKGGIQVSKESSLRNVTSTSGSGNFLSAPDVFFITKVPDIVNTSSVSASFDYNLKGGDLKSVTCQLNLQAPVNCPSKSASFTVLSDGDYTIKVVVELNSGLKTEIQNIFRRDATLPTLNVSMTPASVTSQTTASFVFVASDNLSGINSTQCSIDNATYSTCVSPLSYSALAAGAHNIKIKATDMAGNTSTIYSYSWTIDANVPSVTLSGQPAPVTNLASASFSFTSSKAGSTFQCKLDSAALANCTSPISYSALAAQSHTFSVQAKDSLGNLSALTSYTWTVDNIAPTLPIIMSNVSAYTNSKVASISFSSTDSLSGINLFQCSQDGGAYATCVSPISLSNIADGNHSLSVRAVDKANNTSSVASTSWAVDTVVPVISFSQAPSDSTSASATFSFTSSDSGSGIQSTECSLDNAAFAACTSPVNLTGLSSMAHNFRVQVKDKAANSSIASHSWMINAGPVDEIALGKTLYSLNCAQCHGDIAASTKKDKTAAQITGAINSIAQMSTLKSLSATDIDRIAKALASTVTVPIFSSTGSGKTKVLRISNLEYKNSITDALTYQNSRQGSTTVATTILATTAIKDSFSSLPTDIATKRLATDQLAADQLSTDRFTAFTNISYSIAQALTSSSANLSAFAGSCATNNTDVSNATCLNTFINNFGTLLFRTPPKSAEITELKNGIKSWTDLIGRMLIHPRFLTHYEREGSKNMDGSYNLTAYEIEARLASVIWKSIPDITGLQAASSGTILTSTGLKNEVTRMLASQKAKDTLWTFYQQLFAAQRVPTNFDSGAAFTAFASPIAISSLNSSTFRDSVLQDSRDFLEYITWQSKGSLNDVFRSQDIFTTNSTLASIYGVTPRASSSAAPVKDTTGRYAGILTRAMITQQKPGTNGVGNHVQRGVLFLSNLLGIELGLPASFNEQNANAGAVPVGASSLDEVKIKTSAANCMACHSVINPSGFALAKYDALGRYNDVEKRYSLNSSGAGVLSAQNTIDPTSNLTLNGKVYTITSPASFVNALIDSEKLYQGFSSYYFRFAFNRVEDQALDKGLLDKMSYDLKNDSIQNSMINLVLHPDFIKARGL